MTVKVYDLRQGLAALVTLPDGEHILDTGDLPNRPGCGAPPKDAHTHLLAGLKADLGWRADRPPLDHSALGSHRRRARRTDDIHVS